jgi:hypothetical protein
MDSQTTQCFRRSNCTENASIMYMNLVQTCSNCSVPGHFQTDYNNFKFSWDQLYNVNIHAASASFAAAWDIMLVWLAENSIALTIGSAPAEYVMDSWVSLPPHNDQRILNLIHHLRKQIVIKPRDDHKATLGNHGLVHIAEKFKLNTAYTPPFWISHLFIHHKATAGYTLTFGLSICSISSPSIVLSGRPANDRYIISPTSALPWPTMSTKSTSPQRKRMG